MWQSVKTLNDFNTLTLKQIFCKSETNFKKLEYRFLVESPKIKNASFPYKTAISEANVKTNSIVNTNGDLYMYVRISLFRVDQINSTAIMTNKNRPTPHTDQKWRHGLALYLSLLQSYMYRARFILNSGEHEVLRFIQLNI